MGIDPRLEAECYEAMYRQAQEEAKEEQRLAAVAKEDAALEAAKMQVEVLRAIHRDLQAIHNDLECIGMRTRYLR